MADKLVKSFESLRMHYVQCLTIGHEPVTSQITFQDTSQKKRDTLLSQRERIAFCNTIAEFLPLNSIRELPDFPKLLSISIELLLWACDDNEADVRLVAGEAINKIIKAFLDTNIGRIQVELYKEIKKNGPARPLKAAMQRFYDTCHMIRSQKCRPYVANLLPCLVKIAKRDDEVVQEVLGQLMLKLCPVLGPFFSENDVRNLLKTFIPNLKSASAVMRRTAAASLNAICEFSRNPANSYSWLINVLLGLVVPLSDETKPLTVLGVLLCFRQLIPNLEGNKVREHTLRGSFGRTLSSANDKGSMESMATEKQFLQIYEVAMYCTKNDDHNIVTSALEVLQQLLMCKPQPLLNILLSPDGICPTVSNQEASSQVPSEIDIDEEPEKTDIKSEFEDSVLDDDLQSTASVSGASNFSDWSSSGFGGIKADDTSLTSTDMTLEEGIQSLGNKLGRPDDIIDGRSVDVTSVRDNVSVEQGEEANEDEDKLLLPRTYTQASRASAVSDIPEGEGDISEMEELLRLSSVTSYDASCAVERHFNIDAVACTGVPVLHCIRLMCSFLLEGEPGTVLSDTNTRVSVKSLALSCISHALLIYPEALVAYVLPDENTPGIEGDTAKQGIRDVLLLLLHSDPQIRGTVALVSGNFLKGALHCSRGNYDVWCQELSQKYETEFLPMEVAINAVKSVLNDESAIACKMACTALKYCIEGLCRSCYCFYGLDLVRQMLLLRGNSYWVLKVEMMESLSIIDFRLLQIIERKVPERQGSAQCKQHKFHSLQDEILQTVFLTFLGDEDTRVRLAASQCLANMIPNLSITKGGSLQAMQQAVVFYKAAHNGASAFKGTAEAVNFLSRHKSLMSANLSYVIRKIMDQLNSSKTKFLTHGCCQALAYLSEIYPVAMCLTSWAILPPFGLSTQPTFRDRTLSVLKTASPRRLHLGEMFSGSVGPLAAAFALMTTTWMTSDLQAHQEVLRFCVNVLVGASSQRLQDVARERRESVLSGGADAFGGTQEDSWGILKETTLVAYAARLFQHNIKLLCMIMHVVEQTNPVSTSSKLQLTFTGQKEKSTTPVPGTATPTSQQQTSGTPTSGASHTSSPRKFLLGKGNQRRTMSEVDLAAYDKSPVGKIMDRTPVAKTTDNIQPGTPGSDSKLSSGDSQQSLAEKSDKLGAFYHIPHLIRTYEVLKGSYKNYQVLPVGKRNDKFFNFVHGVLESFSLLLELATFNEVGNFAEEILEYLQSSVKIDSELTFLAVQQLLKALFGTNAGTQPENYVLPYSTKHLIETRGDPTFRINAKPKGQHSQVDEPSIQTGIYENCFLRLLQPSLITLNGEIQKTSASKAQLSDKSSFSLFKRFRKPTTVQKPASKFSKEKISSIQSYIRLFEPLVIHALKTYTMTSSLDIQCQVIHLLDQLIHLRVNYSLLDADQIFIGYVLKQFEFVESGQIRLPQVFVPEVFQFLVLLSYECFQPKFSQAKAIISMPQIIQLCDGLMACGQPATTHAIPALQPIVQDLFVAKGQGRPDSRKELDTQREVIVSMLTRLVQYPSVIGMMVMVLEGAKEDDEKWRRLSRQFIDILFPMLANLQVYIDCEEDLETIQRLLDAVAPVAIRPADIILKTLLTPVKLSSLSDTLRWLTMIIAMTKVLFAQNSEDVILSRLQVVGPTTLSQLFSRNNEGTEQWTPLMDNKDVPTNYTQQLCLYLFKALLVGSQEIKLAASRANTNSEHLNFLSRLLNYLMIHLSSVFVSGRFPEVLNDAKELVYCWSTAGDERAVPTSLLSSITKTLAGLRDLFPTCALLWLQVLKALSFTDQEWWHGQFAIDDTQSLKEEPLPTIGSMKDFSWIWTDGLVEGGALVLYCEILLDQLKNEKSANFAAVCYLLKTEITQMLDLAHEEPINQLISYISASVDLSGLFLQFVSNIFTPRTSHNNDRLWAAVLKPLESVHLNQSTALLQFLLAFLPSITLQGLAKRAETLACRRLQYILSLPTNTRNRDMPFAELEKFLENKPNELRYPCLYILSIKALEPKHGNQASVSEQNLSDPLGVLTTTEEQTAPTKDWLTLFAESICQSKNGWTKDQISVCVELMKALEDDDLKKIMESQNFDSQLLVHCLGTACQVACNGRPRSQETKTEDMSNSIDLSGSPGNKQHLKLLYFSKSILLTKIKDITTTAVKQIPCLKQVEQEYKDIKFTSLNEDVVKEICSDEKRWEQFLILNKCTTILLAPCCFQNRRWRLGKDEVAAFLHFAFISLLTCRIRSLKIDVTFGELNICFENIATVFHTREFWNDLAAREHSALVAAAVDDIYYILSQAVLRPGERLAPDAAFCPVPFDGTEGSARFCKACEKISELVHALRSHFRVTRQSELSRLPRYLIETSRRLIIGLARHPLVNCYARVPPLVWRFGWMPKQEGFFKTELPPLPIDILKEKDVLAEFVLRVNILGWTSRPQFEETWAALLGVLSSPPVAEDTPVEEEIEAAQSSCLAVHCITSLLLDTTLAPVPGNSAISRHSVIHRERDYPFLGSRAGKKLCSIRRIIESDYKSQTWSEKGHLAQFAMHDFLYPVVPSLLAPKQRRQQLHHGCLMEDKLFGCNLEFPTGRHEYYLGQISASAIRTRLESSDVLEDTDSDDSEALIIQLKDSDLPSNKVEELDIRSCLQFLLELFEQWLSPYTIPKTPLVMKMEAVKSLCLLSDLLLELNHFEWILGILLEFNESHPVEDDIMSQYIVPTISKACAVLKWEGAVAERICKIIEVSLKSPHIPRQVSAVIGGLYLMESHVASTTALIVPILTDFLTKHVVSPADDIDVVSQRFSIVLWSAAFYMIEVCSTDIQDSFFVQHVVETAMILLSNFDRCLPTSIANTLLRGLERLVVSFSLTRADCDRVAKMVVRCLSADFPDRFSSTLGLLCTCMYTGKEGEHPSGLSNPELAVDSPITDSRIVVMERLGALFVRIRKGSFQEGNLIAQILPAMLTDFLPVQEIMNKVISEFLSSQQPRPELIAKTAHETFDRLHRQGQQETLRDWILLSLGSFLQRTPLSMAVWSLSCFFVSVSTNQWMHALFPYVLSRKGRLEPDDRRIFCMVAVDFYQNQNLDDVQKRMFLNTFQAKSELGSPYRELVAYCTPLK